jgi:hypothetical protein
MWAVGRLSLLARGREVQPDSATLPASSVPPKVIASSPRERPFRRVVEPTETLPVDAIEALSTPIPEPSAAPDPGVAPTDAAPPPPVEPAPEMAASTPSSAASEPPASETTHDTTTLPYRDEMASAIQPEPEPLPAAVDPTTVTTEAPDSTSIESTPVIVANASADVHVTTATPTMPESVSSNALSEAPDSVPALDATAHRASDAASPIDAHTVSTPEPVATVDSSAEPSRIEMDPPTAAVSSPDEPSEPAAIGAPVVVSESITQAAPPIKPAKADAIEATTATRSSISAPPESSVAAPMPAAAVEAVSTNAEPPVPPPAVHTPAAVPPSMNAPSPVAVSSAPKPVLNLSRRERERLARTQKQAAAIEGRTMDVPPFLARPTPPPAPAPARKPSVKSASKQPSATPSTSATPAPSLFRRIVDRVKRFFRSFFG